MIFSELYPDDEKGKVKTFNELPPATVVCGRGQMFLFEY